MKEFASDGGFYLFLLVLGMIVGAKGDDVASFPEQQPIAGDYVPLNCRNFTIGDWRHRVFYSPQFPKNYPNMTECMQLLVAPKGYRIRLDFKGDFHIEQSEACAYDFLEIRDGPFGYSPLLGRYCGTRHPPMLESSSRFMWIRFKSDDSIQYKGFKAVYDFYKPHTEMNKTNYNLCNIQVDMSKNEGQIDHTDIPPVFMERLNKTGEPLDCTWVVYLPAKHRINLHWLEYKMSTPQICEDSFLEGYERTTAESDRRKKFCGGMAKDYKTFSNHVYLRLFATAPNIVPSFKALLTVYVPGPCKDFNLFECGDNTCINRSLVCNGQENCDFGWDEDQCEVTPEPAATVKVPLMTEYHTVILGIVGGVIFTVIFITICITCHQRRKEEERRRHALKQEERQAIEIEMTNLLNRASPQGTPRRHVMAEANASPHPHHMGNHVGAIPRVSANHVPNGQSNMGGPRRSNSLQSHRSRGSRKNSYGNNLSSGHMSDDELYDHSVDGGTTFKRYLDVHGYNDEDSSPNPSTHNQIPALVTVERYPSSPRRRSCDDMLGATARDKSPSPRPDVVQEEKFIYPDVHQSHQLARRPSVDTERSDKSDVWKPIAPAESLPRSSSGAKQHRRQHSFGRATDILNAEPTPRGAGYSPNVNYHKNQNRTPDSSRVGRTTSEPERLSRRQASVEAEPPYLRHPRPSPVIANASRAPSREGREPMQPVYQLVDTMPHEPRASRAVARGGESPRSKRVKNFKPPPPPRTVTAGGTPTRQAKSSNRTPDIFYTRPNPSRSAPKHQQV